MTEIMLIDDPAISHSPPPRPSRRLRLARFVGLSVVRACRGVASILEWLFGMVSLVLGLSILAALPIAQFLSLGYFLESSARVARSGRLRDGLIGVRTAARVGGMAAGAVITLFPVWIVRSLARSAAIIDPRGPSAAGWQIAFFVVAILASLHLLISLARGGRLRYFLWPIGHLFWVAGRFRAQGFYTSMRDRLWDFVTGMHLPYYLRLGFIGFVGTFCWLVVPSLLIAAGQKYAILGVIGVILLAFIVPFLPFLQIRYAVEGRARVLLSPGAVRDRFRRAPWAFAFSLATVLVAAIPLYLLKLEMIPREAAWLPSLVFVLFLAPARLLTGWAYHRSLRREQPRHWLFRIVGRVAILPVAVLYVIVVFLTQYTSWGGVSSLFEQHAFLLPVPFLDM